MTLIHSFQIFCLCQNTTRKWLLQLNSMHHVCLQCNFRPCLVFKDKNVFPSDICQEKRIHYTQYPSQDQVVEFIRLMVDYELCTVICMDPLHNINSVGAFLILPSRVHNNWLYQLFIYCLLLMTWFSPNCSLYFPTYCKNTIHVTLFYKAVVSILQKWRIF